MNQRVAIADIDRERRAAEALKANLEKLPGMDEQTVADMIEGETSLHEAIVVVVDILTDTEIMLDGVTHKIEELEARKKRFADRKEMLRASIEQAMVIGEIKKKELPDCTLVLSDRAPGVVIVDETRIPSAYFKTPDPVVDKTALKKALKAGEEIEGAVMGNGGVSLTVKRS